MPQVTETRPDWFPYWIPAYVAALDDTGAALSGVDSRATDGHLDFEVALRYRTLWYALSR